MCVRSIKSSWEEGWYPCVLRKLWGKGWPQASLAYPFVGVEAAGLRAVRDLTPGPLPNLLPFGTVSPAQPLPLTSRAGGRLVTGMHRPARSMEQGCRSPVMLKALRLQERSSRRHLKLRPHRPFISKGRASEPAICWLRWGGRPGPRTQSKHPTPPSAY